MRKKIFYHISQENFLLRLKSEVVNEIVKFLAKILYNNTKSPTDCISSLTLLTMALKPIGFT